MNLHSRLAISSIVALLVLCCGGCRGNDALAVLGGGVDRLQITLSIQKEGSECGLVSILLVHDIDGAPPFLEPFPICPDGVAMHGFAMLEKDVALAFLTASSKQGIFSHAQKHYSSRSREKRSHAPANASPVELSHVGDEPDVLEITFTTHDSDWYTYYSAFVPMDAAGLDQAKRLIESLDGDARELMVRLMTPFLKQKKFST